MYLTSILWFLSWPLLIVIGWFLVKFIMTKYNNVFEKTEEANHASRPEE